VLVVIHTLTILDVSFVAPSRISQCDQELSPNKVVRFQLKLPRFWYTSLLPCTLTGYAAEYTSGGGTTLSTDIMLIAYAPKDCFIYPSSYTAIINSGALATWVEQPTAYLDTIVNNFRWYNGGSSAISSCRGVGQVGYPLPNYTTPPYSAPDRNSSSLAHEWRPAGSNNKIEMFNNTDLLNRLIWMGGYVATLAAATRPIAAAIAKNACGLS